MNELLPQQYIRRAYRALQTSRSARLNRFPLILPLNKALKEQLSLRRFNAMVLLDTGFSYANLVFAEPKYKRPEKNT
jgi:hypothetical protein